MLCPLDPSARGKEAKTHLITCKAQVGTRGFLGARASSSRWAEGRPKSKMPALPGGQRSEGARGPRNAVIPAWALCVIRKTHDSIQRPGYAKTDIVVPGNGGATVAIRGTQVPRSVEPRAATQRTKATTSTSRPRATVRWRSHVAAVPAVLHPLPNIPMHVMKPKRIRRERAHRHRPLPVPALATGSVPVAPIVVRLLRRYRPARMKRARRTCPRHVLPLRLAQQPILLASLSRQPANVLLRVLPTHVDDRASPPTPTTVIGTVRATTGPAARVPLLDRHLVHAHRKRLRNRHPVDRSFISTASVLPRR